MRTYPFKRGHKKSIEEIQEIMNKIFGNVTIQGNRLISTYKGLEKIEVWIEKGKLAVETKSRKVGDEDAIDTIKAWNDFLFRSTGYTAKERKKRLTKG